VTNVDTESPLADEIAYPQFVAREFRVYPVTVRCDQMAAYTP
jgi:hypothetical protein